MFNVMERHKMIFRLALFFTAGLMLGAAIVLHAYTKYLTENVYYSRPALEVLNTILALRFVRDGEREKTVELLEWQLDEGLLGLTIYVNGEKDLATKPPLVQAAVAQARIYRMEHPRRLKTKELDDAVRRLLGRGTGASPR